MIRSCLVDFCRLRLFLAGVRLRSTTPRIESKTEETMRVLIAGICGFVGFTLARCLRERVEGIEILGFDNFIRSGSEVNRRLLSQLDCRVFHGDVRACSDFETLPNVDWVIDAAANPSVIAGVDGKSSSRQVIEHNLIGTINLLEYCRRCSAGFILLSTSRVYSIRNLATLPLRRGETRFELVHETETGVTVRGISEVFSTCAPISLYGATKLASEVLALEYGQAFQFPVRVNRCGVLAGAGQFGTADQGIFSYWIHAWRSKQPLKYIGFEGTGLQVRDAFHPNDLAALINKQLSHAAVDAEEQVCNIGGGSANSMSLLELSSWCRDRFGDHTVSKEEKRRQFDIPWVVMDSARAKSRWDWEPKMQLETILDEIAKHAEANPDWLEICGA
jgi:CDP-paratose 2-epimerase